jgi:endonuclease/exonuclease/phosphatase family metal-dependent hydrolase
VSARCSIASRLPPAGPRLAWVAVALLCASAPAARAQQPPGGAVPKPWNAILVASFNIQVFGESKMSKPQVVEVLARVVRNFDIVAIQEVRAKSDEILPAFVRAVNADGSRYQHVIGPREGRTSSKEQYAFVYDSNRIEVDPSSLGVVPDPQGRMHRPPMHARFRTRINPATMAFTFWLVNIHTDPDEVPQELDALTGVFQAMQAARPDEDDVILLGDLNAGPTEFGAFRRIPGIGWAVTGMTTNTRRTKTYDNLVFAWPATAEYRGVSGVLDLQSTFGIPLETALEVSDHNPVWAAFHPCEVAPQGAIGPVAAQPQPLR